MDRISAGFIGCGNMGGAIAASVSRSDRVGKVLLTDPDASKTASLAAVIEKNGCGAEAADLEKTVSESDILFLAVKPQILDPVLRDLTAVFGKRKENCVVVSMVAGRTVASLRDALGNCPLIRIMPNTPAMVGAGLIAYVPDGTDDGTVSLFEEMMGECGMVERVGEENIDIVTAVSGCGPAYAYMFIDAMADAAVSLGMPRGKAVRYAAQTMLGAAEMTLKTGRHPRELKDSVCSPGGSTIEGVMELEKAGFPAAVEAAVIAAYAKTKKL